ncbi:surface antigen BspA-like [Trichomonas vaginalis G3]|uniref:Surface antigen BspA-like n=1 Tax=Trichomonas vaginalis (strain ATCC PRA-98 / G3) TaxID=412133 RepID=A2DXA5_TRIV3|nr:ribonuclease inhibitor domain-containing protein [Trichomonas vaginalis G3]EAY14987.1 surface antigen BspA-like [Trichomonas vaginalis G3]KAI5507336.1 ribonuclease inhibitor domain-containing protein [Trichomonas vaginalis G3]|eukprot:XP_001327210.1 surface antigen BspA-like [Trichomonas vaginalis G3]
MILLALDFKDINESFYSEDGKSLIKVNDTSPYLRISAKCEKIQNECFNGLISLISFSFEDNPNLTTIGSNSFNDCLFLTTINLSYCNKLKYIREKAFYGCNRVEKILLPKGLLEISSGAFIYCNLIKSILVPASVEKIGDRAFVSCSKLENVTFEEGSNLTSLEHHVFYDTNITSFQIPEKVSKINGAAFSDAKLTNLTIHPKNKFFVIENNNFVLSPNKIILFFICNKSSEIPDSVTTLGDSCFENSNIKSITFPNSVISLGENCFWGTNFQTIELPGSLITIGVGCFFGSPINSITIPENVKNINSYAFNFCTNLTNITFLGPFDYIGRGVFEYCISLELIIFHCPPFIIFGDYFISRTSPDCTMCFANKTLFSNETIQKICMYRFHI